MKKQFELNIEDWSALKDFIKTLKDKDKYIIEVKNKDRSYEQLKLYFGAILPAILYFLRDEIKLNNTNELHKYLEMYYAYELKNEYFKPVMLGGQKKYINTFSISFDKCNMEDFNNYLSFIESKLDNLINIIVDNFEDLITEYSKIK